MNLSKKKLFFFAPRGRHGPKLKIRKRAKNYLLPLLNFFFGNLYCPKGPLKHIKNLAPHFLISESYRENQFFTVLQSRFCVLISSRLKLSIKMGPNMSTRRLCMLRSVGYVILVFTDPKLDHF